MSLKWGKIFPREVMSPAQEMSSLCLLIRQHSLGSYSYVVKRGLND